MKIRTTQRLAIEDFSEQKDWIGKLLSPVNSFFTETKKILSEGITFADNMQGAEHLFDFTYQSSKISLPIGFLWTLPVPPVAFHVVSATEDGTSVNIATSWQYTEKGQVQIVQIAKFSVAANPAPPPTEIASINPLTEGSRYKIKVRVTP